MLPVLEVPSHSFPQAEAEAEAEAEADSLVVPSARPKVRAKPAKSLEESWVLVAFVRYLAEVCPQLHDLYLYLKKNAHPWVIEVIWSYTGWSNLLTCFLCLKAIHTEAGQRQVEVPHEKSCCRKKRQWRWNATTRKRRLKLKSSWKPSTDRQLDVDGWYMLHYHTWPYITNKQLSSNTSCQHLR